MDVITDYLLNEFRQRFGNTEWVHVVCAPGRVNLIGGHTDYNDGLVLPMTINKAVYVALRKRADSTIHFHSINFKEDTVFEVNQIPGVRTSHWSNFILGITRELRQLKFVKNRGFEGIIFGDVPIGSGLSSSAALEIALAFAFQSVLGFELEPIPMIQLCQRVEHRYIGVQCGIMDQFAARVGKKNHVVYLDCRSLAYKLIPFLMEDFEIVIVDSKVQRMLDNSKYNERREECDSGVKYFHQINSSITALRDVTLDLCEEHRKRLPHNVFNRCLHVIHENRRVKEAVNYLQQGEFKRFGNLMNESHTSLRDLYEVSCPELDFLVELAQSTKGVLGARITGAGFGGCTVNLVEKHSVRNLIECIHIRYPEKFGIRPIVYELDSNMEARLLYSC